MKNGYYVFDASLSTDVALYYGKVGGDPGMTLPDAVNCLVKNPGFQIIDENGDVVLQYASCKSR